MINKFENEYAFLSNFYESPFKLGGITFPTMEHWFQAWKTLDNQEFREIAAAETPSKAKRLGRKCHLRSDWEDIKEQVMLVGLRLKFEEPKLRSKLLNTKGRTLIEGTTWCDNEWGDCSCPKCTNITGQNKLGKLLMQVRDELLQEEGER